MIYKDIQKFLFYIIAYHEINNLNKYETKCYIINKTKSFNNFLILS